MNSPEFPNYPQDVTLPLEKTSPVPHGIPVADPKYGKPLYKLARLMMKPKAKRGLPKVKSGRKGKKKVAFH